MKFKNSNSFIEFLKAEQQAQKTVLAKHQQQRQKRRMKGGTSFASKYQPSSVEEKFLTAKEGFGKIFYDGELENRVQLTAIFVSLGEPFDVPTEQYQFHSESIIDNEKVALEKELVRMLKPEDPSDHMNWETPEANGYELWSEHVIDMLRHWSTAAKTRCLVC